MDVDVMKKGKENIVTVCSKVWSAPGSTQLEHELVGLIFLRTISNR